MSGIPPIVKAVERLLVDVENAAAAFPRRHRYTFGTDLRKLVWNASKFAHRAFRDVPRREVWIERLVWQMDDVKTSLQLGVGIRAFASHGQFQHLARIAADIGRQAGGWKRQLQHPIGQNAASNVPPQRSETLSTCTASRGANR